MLCDVRLPLVATATRTYTGAMLNLDFLAVKLFYIGHRECELRDFLGTVARRDEYGVCVGTPGYESSVCRDKCFSALSGALMKDRPVQPRSLLTNSRNP